MTRRLVVIGLDCVTPELLFGPWLAEMPNVRRLMADGLHGRLQSTVPPITVPAWMSMMTSHDPGTLGVYGFRNRKSYAYDDTYTVNASHVSSKTVWNILSVHRKRSLVMGVPLTYPPKPLNGAMVGCFLTPDKSATFTYPPELKTRLDALAGGEYLIDVKDFRNDRRTETLAQIRVMTERRFRAFRALLREDDWDYAMMVEMGPDRIHHAFWRFIDPGHRLYQPGNEFEHVVRDYYIELDAEIGRTVDALPADTSVIVVSDHGAKRMVGAIAINEFLMREGYLTLKAAPSKPTRLSADMVDWSRTLAWGDGGYYARVFLNVEGREPNGRIPAAEVPRVRRELKEKLEALGDEDGRPIGTRALFPEEVYRACRGIPPDLIVYLGDLDWRSAGTVGNGRVHLFENDTGPDDANHAPEGIFIWHNRGKPASRSTERVSIYDVAPSILDFYSIAAPADMIGRPL
ncbi:MAG TPA: alkaline phosphatase family protein [Candidatus Krumholzibacteria bacterium]|nr:alkaline phosphatase family protein [Candidatus Krumholzibacteria bacterium]